MTRRNWMHLTAAGAAGMTLGSQDAPARETLSDVPAGIRAFVEHCRELVRAGRSPAELWPGADAQGVQVPFEIVMASGRPMSELGPPVVKLESITLPNPDVALLDLYFARGGSMTMAQIRLWVALERRGNGLEEAWVPVLVRPKQQSGFGPRFVIQPRTEFI